MFNIGPGELIVILILALVLLGPDKLPEVARSVGKGLKEFRRATDDIRSTVEQELYRAEVPRDALHVDWQQPTTKPPPPPPDDTVPNLVRLPPPDWEAVTDPEGIKPVAPAAASGPEPVATVETVETVKTVSPAPIPEDPGGPKQS